jgi:predicted CopG family antitoxin
MVNEKKHKRKTLSIHEDVYLRLQKHGVYNDSVNDIIEKCINSHEKVLATGTMGATN